MLQRTETMFCKARRWHVVLALKAQELQAVQLRGAFALPPPDLPSGAGLCNQEP